MESGTAKSNVERLITGFNGWGRDTPGNLPDLVDDECELVVPDTMPFGGVRRGGAACVGFFTTELWEWFDEFSSVPEGLVDGGDQIVVPVHVTGLTKAGRRLDVHNLWLYAFRDGRIVSARVYADTAAAQEAFAGFRPGG